MARVSELEAKTIVSNVQAKIMRYVEARRIAETAFNKMQEHPEWEKIAELTNMSPTANFGDWTC